MIRFKRLHGEPTWAAANAAKKTSRLHSDESDLDEDEEEDELTQVLRDQQALRTGRTRPTILLPDTLEVARLRDANFQEPSQSVVQTLHWHPQAPLLLTGGFDKTLRLFHIDGKENTKIQSVFLKDMPICNAQFTADGKEILIAGRRKYFYSYDLEQGRVMKVRFGFGFRVNDDAHHPKKIPEIPGRNEKSLEHMKVSRCGKWIAFHGRHGEILLLSSVTKQYIGSVQMSGTVRAIDFTHDGKYLFSTGGM